MCAFFTSSKNLILTNKIRLQERDSDPYCKPGYYESAQVSAACCLASSAAVEHSSALRDEGIADLNPAIASLTCMSGEALRQATGSFSIKVDHKREQVHSTANVSEAASTTGQFKQSISFDANCTKAGSLMVPDKRFGFPFS